MSSPLRAVEDHHVDRPGVEAQQCVKLTGPNSSIDLRSTMYSHKIACQMTGVEGEEGSVDAVFRFSINVECSNFRFIHTFRRRL